MGGEFGGEWIWICMAESLCCPPEIITLLIGYTPIQNKMLGKKKTKTEPSAVLFNGFYSVPGGLALPPSL